MCALGRIIQKEGGKKSPMLEFSNLMQVVEIRVMKDIFGAPRRLALGGVALVYPDQWWR